MAQPPTIHVARSPVAPRMRTPRSAPDAKTIVVPLRRPSGPLLPPTAKTIVEPRAFPRGSASALPAAVTSAPQQVVPTPPPPPPAAFALIRRIALQQSLADAAGVLHGELGTLLGARVVLAQVGDRGEVSSPIPAALREAAGTIPLLLISDAARGNHAVVSDRMMILPLPTTARSVVLAWRAPGAATFEPATVAIAKQLAGRLDVLDHFLTTAAHDHDRAAADKASVFRAEALAASRAPRREGELVDLSSRAVRIAIPAIALLAVALVTLAAIIQVPTYSRGTIVVRSNGRNVIANAGGAVATIYVTPGQRVKAGDPLLSIDATRERQDADQIGTVYRDQLSTFLFDPTDDASRSSLAGILAQRKATREALAAKTITAPIDGAVSDVLVTDVVQPGEHVATIIPAGSAPSIIAFMPGADRSRIQPGATLQIELTGYSGKRLSLPITEVGTEIMGPATARKMLGAKLADAVPLPSSVVIVKAALPAESFELDGKTYSYFDGMTGIAEIEIESKSFLSFVLPTGK